MALGDLFVEVSAVGIQGLSGAAIGYGASGATGPAGATGAGGGASGPQGASGPTGASGVGASGAAGASGSGAAGASGSQGPDGASGAQGASGVGATGAQGIHGASGHDGATGIGGATGPGGGDTGATGAQGIHGASGAQGASGINGASGVGASGIAGASGSQGIHGASGNDGASGIDGATGTQGASGVGASGAQGIHGASGHDGASGAGVAPTTIFTTSSTNEVVVESIDTTLYRSAKYEMQITHSSVYQATELRLLVDGANIFLTQYGSIGESLGVFSTYYSPLSNNYSSPAINTGELSVWNGTNIRFYTTDNTVQQALLSATVGTVLTLNGSVSATLSSKFVETSSGIYDAATTTNKSPSLLISNVTWTGSGEVELRFKPNYAVNTLKYIRTTIET